MEAVDVLGRIDAEQHGEFIDVLRKRQLDEDSVDRRIGIEPVDQGEQLLLRGGLRKRMGEALHPRLERRPALGADIDGARRVLSDQHGGEAGGAAGRLPESRDGVRDPAADHCGDGLPVNDPGGHQ